MTDSPDDLAERVARRGREVVVERLRAAFAHQAATRPGGLQSDPARLEQLVQEAADRSGGALWQRALAQATSDELGVGLQEALNHPAIDQARKLIGAPPWAAGPASTTEAATSTQPAPARAEPAPPEPEPEPAPPEPEPAPPEPEAAQAEPVQAKPVPVTPPPRLAKGADRPDGNGQPSVLRLGAVHVSGIETLRPGERDIELRLSDVGLDVLKRSTGAAIGRLAWSEIETIELPTPRRGLRTRRRNHELRVSTGRGQAQFELPGLSEEELNDHVRPMLDGLLSANGRAASDQSA